MTRPAAPHAPAPAPPGAPAPPNRQGPAEPRDITPLIAALRDVAVRADGRWTGTTTDLLAAIGRGPSTAWPWWPPTASSLGMLLRRRAAEIAAAGVTVRRRKIRGRARFQVTAVGA